MAQVSAALQATNAHWQVTMATYAARPPTRAGFYDIAGLAPAMDGFFVMAYDMNEPEAPAPRRPLAGSGYTDRRPCRGTPRSCPPRR